MNIKKILVTLCSALLISSCASTIPNEPGKRGELRDAIYSIEPRANGAYVLWLRYDGEGVYCTTDTALVDTARRILNEGSGWAKIEYYTLNKGEVFPAYNTCMNVEGSKGHTIYIMSAITETSNQQ